MAQHDYVIANASGAAVRADLNNALSAIVTNNSGAAAPTPTYAYHWWPDTTSGLLKIRNAANTDWVTIGTLATANLGLVVAPAAAGTADQVLATDGSGVQSWSDRARLVRATSQASTSGTSIDFTDIPTWAKKITVMLSNVSTSGTNSVIVQLGSTTFTATGYLGASSALSSAVVSAALSTGFRFSFDTADVAAAVRHGQLSVSSIAGNTWVANGVAALSDSAVTSTVAGTIALGGVLDRVRVTTVGTTDTFDAGTINIIYEG
jgi:hypothetical protein